MASLKDLLRKLDDKLIGPADSMGGVVIHKRDSLLSQRFKNPVYIEEQAFVFSDKFILERVVLFLPISGLLNLSQVCKFIYSEVQNFLRFVKFFIDDQKALDEFLHKLGNLDDQVYLLIQDLIIHRDINLNESQALEIFSYSPFLENFSSALQLTQKIKNHIWFQLPFKRIDLYCAQINSVNFLSDLENSGRVSVYHYGKITRNSLLKLSFLRKYVRACFGILFGAMIIQLNEQIVSRTNPKKRVLLIHMLIIDIILLSALSALFSLAYDYCLNQYSLREHKPEYEKRARKII